MSLGLDLGAYESPLYARGQWDGVTVGCGQSHTTSRTPCTCRSKAAHVGVGFGWRVALNPGANRIR